MAAPNFLPQLPELCRTSFCGTFQETRRREDVLEKLFGLFNRDNNIPASRTIIFQLIC